jgi:molybdopterin/thiamine biosynthesis adenylyltransferase
MEDSELILLLAGCEDFSVMRPSADPILQKRGLDLGYELSCTVEDHEIRMLVGFDRYFPRHKPSYFLQPVDALGYIPHIETDGWICYSHDDYLFMDADNPAGVIAGTFALAKKTLQDGYLRKNEVDFLNEFESYWKRLAGCKEVYASLTVGGEVRKIKIGKRGKLVFALDDEADCAEAMRRLLGDAHHRTPLSNGIYIPLRNGAKIFPPAYDHQFSVQEIYTFIWDNLSDANKKEIAKLSEDNSKREHYIFFSFEQPNGNRAIGGFKFFNRKGYKHPLTNRTNEYKIEPLYIERMDREYLLKRGGNGSVFLGKRGLLIGCGSVGGYIGEELIKSSFLDLTLVDGELLGPENSYRHACGAAYLDENKAEAMKKKLEEFYPHARVTVFDENIEILMQKGKIDFSAFDYVVVATGNVTINLYLNEYLIHHHPGLPAFFSWVDPYGIGGHCLVTNLDGKGCYNCLYNNEEVFNIASFAGKQQTKPFLKSISGCGSVYTPFGSLDALQTALLTVRKIGHLFRGYEKGSAVYSWKGETELFLAEGFALSPRFQLTEQELEAGKQGFYSPHCNVCQS